MCFLSKMIPPFSGKADRVFAYDGLGLSVHYIDKRAVKCYNKDEI